MKTILEKIKENTEYLDLGDFDKWDLEDQKPVVEDWILDNLEISGKYTWRKNKNIIDVDGDVILNSDAVSRILPEGFYFGTVTGNCIVDNSKLETLEGCPYTVNGDFSCKNCNKLEDLLGAPNEVNGTFDCSDCKNLKYLYGLPEELNVLVCKNINIKNKERILKTIDANKIIDK